MEQGQPSPTPPERTARSRKTLILALALASIAGIPGGIVAILLFLFCDLEFALLILVLTTFFAPILGSSAWLLAKGDLNRMQVGIIPESGLRVTNVGRTLAIFGTFGTPLVFFLWLVLWWSLSPPALSQNKDSMINHLHSLFADAYQYRLRPSSERGGQGSYIGYSLPEGSLRDGYGIYSARAVHSDSIHFYAKWKRDTTSTISVMLGPDGRPAGWRYGGDFE